MIVQVEQDDGTFIDEEREPKCGDGCDTCGHCLHCNREDPCFAFGEPAEHVWVIYRCTS